MTYTPTYIKKYETGLVQSRQNFLLPDDAYPVLENAFVWRERIKRKSGYRLLGRLKRDLTATLLVSLVDIQAGINTFNIFTVMGVSATQPDASLVPGSAISPITLLFGPALNQTWIDSTGTGVMTGFAAPITSVTINYATGDVTYDNGGAAIGNSTLTITLSYYPNLPVMGLRPRELNNINFEQTIAFDTVYAYRFVGGSWEEFIPGTTWTGTDSDFFWSTNYWVGDGNQKLFWVTNFSGTSGDPIRYTNGTVWVDFAPQINTSGDVLAQCLAMVPFRSRMVAFNTYEGANLGASVQFRQRIRWAAIGNPITTISAAVSVVSADAWRDDIPGKGGFLDIPTSEDITAIGFVRDNLVVFCERSTWQLRYTGRSIAPFQIEKVNTELGAESTFSAVQFDTSLVGIGDKGIVQCDSYKSERIDVKIPDLVFRFNNLDFGINRVHGIRDYQQRIAYWTYAEAGTGVIFPNRRLVYNYENDSWAIFKDSFTTLGYFQSTESFKWEDFPGPLDINKWQSQTAITWLNRTAELPQIIGGNQQGYVEILGQFNFDAYSINDKSLFIKDITGNTTTPTSIESPNHNLQTGDVIKIFGIIDGSDFDDLNGVIFGIRRTDEDNFLIYTFSSVTGKFDFPQLNSPGTYLGGGEIVIRDNFKIQSKKFNYLDKGETIQFGFMDILLNNTSAGAITLNIYGDYNDTEPTNTFPQNPTGDTFFNTEIRTYSPIYKGSSKNIQRIYCTARSSFITLEFTYSDAQMNGVECEEDVQIDSQILWMRPAGRQLNSF